MLRAARRALKQLSAAAGGRDVQCTGHRRQFAASCPAHHTAAPILEVTMCDRRSGAQKHHDGPQPQATGTPQRFTSRGFSSIIYPPVEAKVGEKAPEFTLPAVVNGEISSVSLRDYMGMYVVLFWYPKDFSVVCPTEIIAFNDRSEEFHDLNTQLIAGSTDTEEVHLAWIRTPRDKGGLGAIKIPIVSDTTKEISARYGVLKENLGVDLRGLFIINPEGAIEQITTNNLSVGRNVDEAKRLVQAIQFVAEHGEVCPANWKPGGKGIKTSAEGSKEYFAAEGRDDEVEKFGKLLRPIFAPQEFFAIIQDKKPVVAEFYAPWCPKCRQIAPFVEKLQEEHPEITIVKIDTTDEELGKLADEEAVTVLPTFKFFKDGKEVLPPVMGYKKKPLEDAIQELAKLAKY